MVTPVVMITNGGPHPPEKWAEVTAGQIVQFDNPQAQSASVRLQVSIMDVLEKLHGTIADDEAEALSTRGDARLAEPLDVEGEQDLDAMTEEVLAATKGHGYDDHFSKPEVRDHVRALLKKHFRANMDTQRSWHADQNQTARSRAWQKARTDHGPRAAHKTHGQYLKSSGKGD